MPVKVVIPLPSSITSAHVVVARASDPSEPVRSWVVAVVVGEEEEVMVSW